MTPFSSEKLQKILAELSLKRPTGRAIAAFDADGTLWNTDMGEAFFEYKIRHGLIQLPEDPWLVYERMKAEVSHPAAYLWLAQILKGVSEEQVRKWAADCVQSHSPVPIFKEVQTIIDHLHRLQVEVYIVTASIRWAVEPAAKLFGIPEHRVVGIKTKILDGRVTDAQEGALTYREGKVTGLLEATGGHHAYFCAGNTEGDLALLESATQSRLVIAGSDENNSNFPTERRMLKLAAERGWFFHDYL